MPALIGLVPPPSVRATSFRPNHRRATGGTTVGPLDGDWEEKRVVGREKPLTSLSISPPCLSISFYSIAASSGKRRPRENRKMRERQSYLVAAGLPLRTIASSTRQVSEHASLTRCIKHTEHLRKMWKITGDWYLKRERIVRGEAGSVIKRIRGRKMWNTFPQVTIEAVNLPSWFWRNY